jgi:hypothetical protein
MFEIASAFFVVFYMEGFERCVPIYNVSAGNKTVSRATSLTSYRLSGSVFQEFPLPKRKTKANLGLLANNVLQ